MATDPGTRSPGSVFLRYLLGQDYHTVACKYIVGVDIQAVSACRADAQSLADVLKACLPLNNAQIVGWGLRDPTGSPAYEEAFANPILATKNGNGQMYASLTLTIPGLGTATGVGGAKGKTRFVWFCGGAYMAPIRQTKLAPIPTEIGAIITLLRTNLRFFADYYGQHAEPKGYVDVQYNARVQKHLGS